MSTYSTKMCKEPGGLPKGFSVVDLTNWRQGILWFSVSRRRISNFPNDSGTFSRLVGEGWRRLANSIRVTMKMVGRQCAIARWNWQKHATLQRASEYWIWIFGSGCPKLLGDLTKLKALKETQTPSKDTPPNIIAVRLAGNLESQSSIPPRRCYEVGIRKTQLKSNNVQQISNTISTISNNKTTSRVRLKDLSWSPSRFGRLPFQRRHAGRSANPAATTAKTLGIDWCQCGFVLHFDMSNCVNQHSEFFWIILVSPMTWRGCVWLRGCSVLFMESCRTFCLKALVFFKCGQCGVCSLETPKPQLSTLAGWCIWLSTPSARVHKPVAEACPKNAWGCGLLREQRNQ